MLSVPRLILIMILQTGGRRTKSEGLSGLKSSDYGR